MIIMSPDIIFLKILLPWIKEDHNFYQRLLFVLCTLNKETSHFQNVILFPFVSDNVVVLVSQNKSVVLHII